MLSKSGEHTDQEILPTGGWGGNSEDIYTQATHSASQEIEGLLQLCSRAPAVVSEVKKWDGIEGRQTSPYLSPVLYWTLWPWAHDIWVSVPHSGKKEMIISLRYTVRVARDNSFNTSNAKQLLNNIHSSPLPSPESGFPGGTSGKEPTWKCRRRKRQGVQFMGQEEPLKEGTATHSNILAWRIPWTEEPGRLPFMGSKTVGHDWSNLAYLYTHFQE